jgi:predicted tellurium resistance membrane protein TerC
MEWLANPDTWIAFLTLCALEIVLGIDNIVFISILTNKLPAEEQEKGRRLGLMLALLMRLGLLFSISWMMQLTEPLFGILGVEVSGRDIILILGGLFLIYKSVKEIHHKVEEADEGPEAPKKASFASVVGQIILIDLVFSLDSVITAVGMVDRIEIMIAAVVVSMVVMLAAAGPISRFVNNHPAIKILALAFLILIGVALLGQGLDFDIPKGYIYFAMAFALAVEMVNIRLNTRKKAKKAA